MVIASRECPGAELARERGITTRVIGGTIPRDVLGGMLQDAQIGLVVLAGYLKLVQVPRGYEGRVVNIHPALLPGFGGPGMHGEHVHRAVLDAGCKVSGCTVHLCDERYDTGPILAQAACEVRDDDSPASLAARVFALECDLYPRTLERLLAGRVKVLGRRAWIEGA
jgi:phosphoribosylglycinamide formyltransferase-1